MKRNKDLTNRWLLFSDKELFQLQDALQVQPFDHGFRAEIGYELKRRKAKLRVKVTMHETKPQ